jgi:hypothetical protein
MRKVMLRLRSCAGGSPERGGVVRAGGPARRGGAAWVALEGALIGVTLLAGPGCEQRVVRYESFLTGLPQAQQSLPAGRDLGDYVDPTLLDESTLVKVDPATRKKTLTARNGRHLMIHLYTTVDENDYETFVSQVLSQRSRAEFAQRGVDPREGFAHLRRKQADLQILFQRMPGGENTPGLRLRDVGGGARRVEVDGIAAKGLYWTGFDMVQERGNWKLRWMTGPQKYIE